MVTWYRMHVETVHGVSAREFSKEGENADAQALEHYATMRVEAEKEKSEGRLYAKPTRLWRVDVVEKITVLTPSPAADSPFADFDDAG